MFVRGWCRALRGVRGDPPRAEHARSGARVGGFGRPPVRDRYGAGREAQYGN